MLRVSMTILGVVGALLALSGCQMPGTYVAPPPITTGAGTSTGGTVTLPPGSNKPPSAKLSTQPGATLPVPGK